MAPYSRNANQTTKIGRTPTRTSLRKRNPKRLIANSTPMKNRQTKRNSLKPQIFSPSRVNMKVIKASKEGDLDLLKDLIQHSGPAVRAVKNSCTLLHTAAAHDQVEVVEFLLKLISPNIVNLDRQTPAHLAAMKGNTEVLKVLLDDDEMNPDLQDYWQRTFKDWLSTPLFDAIRSGNDDRAKELLSMGANPDCHAGSSVSNPNISTARELATTLGKGNILNVLPGVQFTPVQANTEIENRFEYFVDGQRAADYQKVGPLRLKMQPASLHVSGDEAYKIDTPTRGYVCLLSYNSFKGRPDLDLEASEDDAHNLANVFNQMNYTGDVHFSLTKKNTKDTLMKMRDMQILNDVGCAIFIISSHSINNNSTFLTSDMEHLTTDWVMNLFKDTDCPQLKGKPKLFIFDFSCGYYTAKDSTLQKHFTPTRVQEPSRDMVCLYSNSNGFASYNYSKNGSAFITSLCRTLAEHSHDKELYDFYSELITECGKNSSTAVPQLRNVGFTKNFYFNSL